MTSTGADLRARPRSWRTTSIVNQRNTAERPGRRPRGGRRHAPRPRRDAWRARSPASSSAAASTYVGVADVSDHADLRQGRSRAVCRWTSISPSGTYPDVQRRRQGRGPHRGLGARVAKAPPASWSSVLGMRRSNNDTEMHAILAEYGLPYRFEPEGRRGGPGHRRPRSRPSR